MFGIRKPKRLFYLSGLFFIGFFLFAAYYHGTFYCHINIHPVGIFEKIKIISDEGFFLILGGSLSNIYCGLQGLPTVFKQDFSTNVISIAFFSTSVVHLYASYRLLQYIWQEEILKWYWWGIWVTNCYVWFFMGSIIPLMMRL